MSLQLNLEPIINEAINSKLSELNLEQQIKDLVEDVAKNATKVLEIKLENGKSTKFTLYHEKFELLLNIARIKGTNILLTGGAGLSKSTAVEQVAEALQLPLSSISFSNQTTKTDLLGFVDANGRYMMSGFVKAFKDGHIFLADEMDACSSNVLVLLNSAIANGRIELPNNEVVYAHDNFRFIATANTNLRGAKGGYTARNKLDMATVDRFIVIEWTLDLDLEEKITQNDGWLKIVRTCRAIAEMELDGVAITPRSSYDGAKLLKHGIDIDTVIEATIVKAMGEDERKTLLAGITENMRTQAVKDSCIDEPKVVEPKVVEPEIDDPEIDDPEIDFNW